jgi:ABC-type thiamin/hydroxymethylpyrimidine transport system permease subunit
VGATFSRDLTNSTNSTNLTNLTISTIFHLLLTPDTRHLIPGFWLLDSVICGFQGAYLIKELERFQILL